MVRKIIKNYTRQVSRKRMTLNFYACGIHQFFSVINLHMENEKWKADNQYRTQWSICDLLCAQMLRRRVYSHPSTQVRAVVGQVTGHDLILLPRLQVMMLSPKRNARWRNRLVNKNKSLIRGVTTFVFYVEVWMISCLAMVLIPWLELWPWVVLEMDNNEVVWKPETRLYIKSSI